MFPLPSHPRLILEIPRGSERYRQLHTLRSASERTNSTLKEDNAILREPPVRCLRRAEVVSLMGVMTTLIDRVVQIHSGCDGEGEEVQEPPGTSIGLDQLSPPEIPAHLKPFAKTA